MQERAEAATVTISSAPDRRLKFATEPLLHYSATEANILDGALWVWGDSERPQAFLKVEAHRWDGDDPPRVTWVYCFVSTAGEQIKAEWPNGLRYTTTEHGLDLKTIDDAPSPAAEKSARLNQMKELARRFSVRVGSAAEDRKMRLLATPVHRYDDPQSGLRDGAVFAFVAGGSNPGVVLLLEMHQPEGQKPKWQYSLARLGVAEVEVKLAERVVYKQEYTGLNPVQEPTWMWFFAKGRLPEESGEKKE